MLVRRAGVVFSLLAFLMSGCSEESPAQGTLRVFAAASLTEVFGDLGRAFESAHVGLNVEFSFAASPALAQQVNDATPADVFASADTESMRKVIEAGNADAPRTIARNRLSIIVEKGNPRRIEGLADLADPELILIMCAPEVPCGELGAAAFRAAGVSLAADSLEENVKAVVSKVTLGEADAGVVYETDVRAAADEADGVAIEVADAPALHAVYRMAIIKHAKNADAAAAWMDFVLSDRGTRALTEFGFLAA